MRRCLFPALGLAVVLVGCGGSSTGPDGITPPPPGASNGAPTAAINASAAVALVNVTRLSFTAQATDPNGDALTYEWNFGDGTTATGQTAQKIYDRPGAFAVTLKVTDSKGASTSATASVAAKAINGFWNDESQGYGIEVHQDGTNFSGRTVFRIRDLTGDLRGAVNEALEVQYKTTYFGGAFRDYYEARLAPDLDSMSGTLSLTNGSVTFKFNVNLVRQK